MTITATEPLVSGPYNGNGVTTTFGYGFRVFAETELLVFLRDALNVETLLELTTDYIVLPTGGDYPSTGGTVSLSFAPAVGEQIVILPNITRSQDRPYSSQSSITLQEVEDALDKVTALTRQLYERSLRAVTVSAFDPGDVDTLLANITALIALESQIQTLTDNLATLQAVEDALPEIATVEDNIAAVTIVALAIAAVNTTATNIASVNTVAANIANINTLAAAVAAVNTVAANIANVNAVGSNIASVNAVAAELPAITDVAAALASIISAQPSQYKMQNPIINGNFMLWTRATSSSASGYVACDRWINSSAGGTVTQSLQNLPVPTFFGRNAARRCLRQTVSGQTLAAHQAQTAQRMEDVRQLSGKTVTVLGWARRVSGAGDLVLEGVQRFGTGGSPSAAVTGISPTLIPLSASWQPFAVVLTYPSISSKTIGTNEDSDSAIGFWASAGSDWSSRVGGLIGLQTIGYELWGVHIREGTHTVAAVDDYVQEDDRENTDRCARYLQTGSLLMQGPAAGLVSAGTGFMTRMRRVPDVVASPGANANYVGGSLSVQGVSNVSVSFNASITASGGYVYANFTADAEIV